MQKIPAFFISRCKIKKKDDDDDHEKMSFKQNAEAQEPVAENLKNRLYAKIYC